MGIIALYGGAFDMPTLGHVLAASYVLATQDVDTLFILPTFQHALGKNLAPFDHRMKMCRLAFESLDPEKIFVSETERKLGGISYTLRTVEYLKTLVLMMNFVGLLGLIANKARLRGTGIGRKSILLPLSSS